MRYSSHQFARAFRDLARETAPAKRRSMIREFLTAVAKNSSLGLLPDIIREYELLSDREKKIRHVMIRSPERLPAGGVARRLRFKAQVKAERNVRLLGGAVVELGDLRIDNSIARRMQRAREALTR